MEYRFRQGILTSETLWRVNEAGLDIDGRSVPFSQITGIHLGIARGKNVPDRYTCTVYWPAGQATAYSRSYEGFADFRNQAPAYCELVASLAHGVGKGAKLTAGSAWEKWSTVFVLLLVAAVVAAIGPVFGFLPWLALIPLSIKGVRIVLYDGPVTWEPGAFPSQFLP